MNYQPLKRTPNKSRKIRTYKYIKKKVLERDNYKCVDCGKKAEVTHHIIPVWQDPTKANNMTNIQSLCKECHYKKHLYTQTP